MMVVGWNKDAKDLDLHQNYYEKDKILIDNFHNVY